LPALHVRERCEHQSFSVAQPARVKAVAPDDRDGDAFFDRFVMMICFSLL